MNSLQIYEIPELKDIITGYQKQFEYIDELEKELDSGYIDFEMSFSGNEVRFEIDIRKDIRNIYLNGELKCVDWDFVNCFDEEMEYAQEAIYQHIVKKILYRYCILPFDKYDYYDNIDAILYMIFDERIESILNTVERTLIDEYLSCQLRHQELDTDVVIYEECDNIYCRIDTKNFYNKILEYINNGEPFIVRDNYGEICEFFRKMNM